MADHLGRYREEMATRQDQLATAWEEVPTSWQGHCGQAAQEELALLLNRVSESLVMANSLRRRLLKAKHAFEQAGLAGLNGLSLGSLESSWVPRSSAGGDQGALTGPLIAGGDVLSKVGTFATNEGPPPVSGDTPPGGPLASRFTGNQ